VCGRGRPGKREGGQDEGARSGVRFRAVRREGEGGQASVRATRPSEREGSQASVRVRASERARARGERISSLFS
jgi:hypothetical protein